MGNYEIMYIVNPNAEEKLHDILTKYEDIINTDGEVESTSLWGKKHLAYEIRGCEEGYYILVMFKATSKCVREVDRVMKLSEDILRHMIIRKSDMKELGRE